MHAYFIINQFNNYRREKDMRSGIKSLMGCLCITLLLSHTFIDSYAKATVYENGMNPGMLLRVEQSSIYAFKKAMSQFLPRYINHDLNLPTEYSYEFSLFFELLVWKYHWKNIQYNQGQFDFDDVHLYLERKNGEPLLTFDFPTLKSWKISATQETNEWFVPQESPVRLEFHDFDFDWSCYFELEETGFLKPIVKDVKIKFGESYFYHDDWWSAFVMHQFIEFALVMVENATTFVGRWIYTNMFGPVMTAFLHEYRQPVPFQTMIHGQTASDFMTLDYRNTREPFIGEGWMDFYFLGEWSYDGQECGELVHDPMEFIEDPDFTQLVISEAGFSCYLNMLAKTNLGTIDLNTDRMNQMLSTEGVFKFDTVNLGKMMPIVKKLFPGPKKDLRFILNFKDINVLFGQFDTDAIVEYTMLLSIYEESMERELFFDEIRFVTSMDIKSTNDVIFAHILNHKIDTEGKYGHRTAPLRNQLGLSANDYRDWLKQLGFVMKDLKTYLNEHYFPNGMRFPYSMDQFYSNVFFKEKSVHFMLEVMDDAAEWFEDDYWKE